ncbi:MAG: RNA polymerase sigma factor RpoD/SigA [Candidatus Pedobacter colombiensis]|uniref:RNA polymerase sigma factor RpoD/SigA n=1 Tax=Candidatus Pedobacter colombiensis TaxID=3121371 RepID=A0AAJ5W8X6_9SPHI|nr:RNA polymerase sigma factor RpoD/SigA [Pedobacter sp.]WEK20873.1 MAG: RNA polymerase sigma factor RpoD/SigA [Pedobacter sp.]
MKQFRVLQSIIRRDSDSVERYLNDIGKINLLSMEDEVRLAGRIRKGDAGALQQLVKGNLRFVVSVAKKYQERGLKLSDLISEGNIGLIKAAKYFDDTKGFKFISFAVWWIRQSILLAIAEQKRLVRLPVNQVVAIDTINRAIIALEQKLERMPTAEELISYTSLSADKIFRYINSTVNPYSLHHIVDEKNGFTLLDTIDDKSIPKSDHLTFTTSLLVDLNRSLSILPKREQKILMLFYGINGYPQTSLDDMEPIFNLGRERIRKLRDKAHKTLSLNCGDTLSDYLN